MLEKIKTPQDLKKLSEEELVVLCGEIREKIISVVDSNGGHLSANLGTVELIVALYYVFDFPKDKVIFDVGHQSYTHKILSERADLFETLRKEGGLSGFPSIFESEYDSFCSGHAGSSISAGLGYAFARDRKRENNYVICVIGDGALINGEALEALTNSPEKPEKFLIILNDNGMSINKNDSGLYKLMSGLSRNRTYSRTMRKANRKIGKNFFGRFLKRIKSFIKRLLSPYAVLEEFGLRYIGAYDGNNLKQCIKLLKDIKKTQRVNLLHLKTVKGKGLSEVENNSDKYHGVSKHLGQSVNSFSLAVSEKMIDLAEKNNFVAITAGMKDGTGLAEFSKKYPERFIDVGIAEEHAVTLASGISLGGIKPYVFIYSTFLQRAYDQVLLDLCLQERPAVLCLDRAGLVGSDGQTHQGTFDLSYLTSMPNLTLLAPKDVQEFKDMLDFSVGYDKPLAIRYCNGKVADFEKHSPFDLKWEKVIEKQNAQITLICCGYRMNKLAMQFASESRFVVNVVNARVVMPLDEQTLLSITTPVITLEENVLNGGLGALVTRFYSDNAIFKPIKNLGIKNEFIKHGSVDSQLAYCDLTIDNISNVAEKIINEKV